MNELNYIDHILLSHDEDNFYSLYLITDQKVKIYIKNGEFTDLHQFALNFEEPLIVKTAHGNEFVEEDGNVTLITSNN